MWFKVYTDSLDDNYGKPKTLINANYFTEIKPGYDNYFNRYFIALLRVTKSSDISKSFTMDNKETLDKIMEHINKNIGKDAVIDIQEMIDKLEGEKI